MSDSRWESYVPCLGFAAIVLAPAAVTLGILIVRRPDHRQVRPPPPEPRTGGFPVIAIDRPEADGVTDR